MIKPLRTPLRTPLKRNLVSQGVIDSAIVNLDDRGIASSSGVITEWTNSGTGGSAYDLDVILGTGANLKPHDIGSALFYGASGDYISTPDSVANSISGDSTFIAYVGMDDWTPSGNETFVAKYTTIGSICKLFIYN